MRKEKITFACMTKPHLSRLQVLLPKVVPYVDKAVIVIGERNEEAEKYIKTFSDKVVCIYRPWDDRFDSQWNVCLHYICDGWVLVLDDDEVPSGNMLDSLDGYINDSEEGEKCCCIGFRCNPISEGQDLGPCNYHRQVFFRYSPNMKYVSADSESGSHQCLTGYQNGNMIHSKDDEVYYHIKSLEDEYRNASRNYVTYGIWIDDKNIQRREEWYELKQIIKNIYPEISTFPEFDKKMKEGIHQELIDWAIKWHHNLKEGSEYFVVHSDYEYWHYNECRAIISYMFKYLYPEQKPEGMEL